MGLLYAQNFLLLASTNAAMPAKTVENTHRHSAQLYKRQIDTKVSSSRRASSGALTVEVSAQTNGFLRFADAASEQHEQHLVERVPARLIRSASGPAESAATIHLHTAMPSKQALSDTTGKALSASIIDITVPGGPGGNTTAADNDWSAVSHGAHVNENATGSNITAADNDWSTVAKQTGATVTTQNATEENTTAVDAPPDTPPNVNQGVNVSLPAPGANAANNLTQVGNQTLEPSDNTTQPEGNANEENANATQPEVNATQPEANTTQPEVQPEVNATQAKPDEVNATSDKSPPPAPPAPPPVTPVAAPAPPPVIINKIINKVNVTVHVTVNGSDDGTTVKSSANSKPYVTQTGNKSSQASKTDDPNDDAEDGKMPMDIWKDIVKAGTDSSKTGGRNARVSDSSL